MRKRKKGFTLIELIASIAILAIAFSGIGIAMTTSSNINKNDEKKVDNNIYSQFILQTLKSQGKNYLKSLYPGKSEYEGYFYFNTKDDLNNALKDSIFLPGTYDNMVTNMNTSTNKYGAYLKITTTKTLGKSTVSNNNITLGDGFDTLRVYTKVIDLKDKEISSSALVVYLGR